MHLCHMSALSPLALYAEAFQGLKENRHGICAQDE